MPFSGYLGKVPLLLPFLNPEFVSVAKWAVVEKPVCLLHTCNTQAIILYAVLVPLLLSILKDSGANIHPLLI